MDVVGRRLPPLADNSHEVPGIVCRVRLATATKARSPLLVVYLWDSTQNR